VCSASNELRLARNKMTPPWPSKLFNVGSNAHVHYVAFSPSGSQLAFSTDNIRTAQYAVNVWDRWGKDTSLGGHTGAINCLEYSLDGEYLATASKDGSIRVWTRESFHNTTSQTHRERITRTPKQAEIILVDSRISNVMALSFSRTDSNLLASGGSNDSNLLASGGSNGEIKVWNVKEQACVHTFNTGRGFIRSLFFAEGAVSACLAATHDMSIIRLWRPEGSSEFASETIGNTDVSRCIPRPVFSPSGSFLATSFSLMTGNGNESTIALYELDTMTTTQSVVMPDFAATCFALSPDSKQLIIGAYTGKIRLLQADDLGIQRDLDSRGEVTREQPLALSVVFDPTCRVLAVGYRDGGLELRSL
jgi:WD40 repeat protein